MKPSASKEHPVDQPQVIEFKTWTLAELGVAPIVDRRLISVDLRDGRLDALCQ
ncbi:class I SAM-dependent methyltransferase [Mycobacterium simulans]|uniref:class I SAM-dependent methyltransferase n=1 Tax=Mycobacterium simulans TaxID=627089 RepID=UPI001749481B